MNYKLINKLTGEEHICQKMVVDGWDYYVSGEIIKNVKPHYGKWQIEEGTILNKFPTYLTDLSSCRLVVASNNPNIDDIPKVVDEVERLGEDETNIRILKHKTPSQIARQYFDGFIEGYNKSQETHSFSEEDMLDFAEWCEINYSYNQKRKHWYKYTDKTDDIRPYTTEELLQLWKEQKPKTIWYE